MGGIMKIIALRLFALAALIGTGSWAVWGADKTPGTATSPALKKPTSAFTVVQQEKKLPGLSRVSDEVVAKTLAKDAEEKSAPTPTPAAARPALPSTTTSIAPTITSEPTVHLSLSTLTPTPEMWFYEQMRQDYNNPALQMRLRGERAAAERRARLAAREWYGVSLGRPMAHVTPFTYYYSPFWASNQRNPFLWTSGGAGPVIIEARRPATVSGFGVW
jgi:hypothetical protein